MTGKSAGVCGLRRQCVEWHCALVRVDGKEGMSLQDRVAMYAVTKQ